jgi:hypothetical protein
VMLNKEKEPKITNAAQEDRDSEGEEKKNFENGYSETEQVKDIEARSGDLQALKASKAFQQLQGSAKVLSAYQFVSKKLCTLVENYTTLIEKDLHQAQRMHHEIAKIRGMQKMLLMKLFGKLPNEYDREEILEELEQLGI